MNKKTIYFRTKFGDQIALDPRVERVLYPVSIRAVEEQKKMVHKSYLFREEHIGKKIQISEIGNDLFSFAVLIDLLEELNLLPIGGYKYALDIGGAEGVHAALFRGLYSEKCDVADLLDGRDPNLTKRLKKAIRGKTKEFIIDYFFSRFSFLAEMFKHKYPWGIRRLANAKSLNAPSSRNYYNFRFRRKPTVDNFFVGDWFETVKNKYDFIMNFQCFWVWDHKLAFRQIASLLEEGGIFAVNAPYCWAGRASYDSSGILGGQFPFFEQRLVLDDIKRYYMEHKPSLVDVVDTAYASIDISRPTVRTYTENALKEGLILKGYKRLYHRQNYALCSNGKVIAPKTVYAKTSDAEINVDVDEVLQNINRFRNDVGLEDLITRAVVMVFEKV